MIVYDCIWLYMCIRYLYAIHMLEVQTKSQNLSAPHIVSIHIIYTTERYRGARQAYRHGMRCTGKASPVHQCCHPPGNWGVRAVDRRDRGNSSAAIGFCTNEDAPDSGWLIITYYNSKYRYSWLTEGSSKVKLPTIWTDGKAEVGRVRTEKRRRKKIRERVRGTKVQVREKVEKLEKPRNTVFFQWFVAPEGRKVGLLKRRVRRLVVRWEIEKCTPLRREAHFQVKMHKALQRRTTFGSWDVEKVHAVVARSTLGSCAIEKVYAIVARSTFRSQKCKKMGYGTLLDVQMSFCVAGAGDCAPCQKWAKREQNVRVL